MSNTTWISIAGLAALTVVAVQGTQSGTGSPTTPESERINRGQYLVTIGGCNDCHTPWKVGEKGPEPDMSRMLSGHPAGFRHAARSQSPGIPG